MQAGADAIPRDPPTLIVDYDPEFLAPLLPMWRDSFEAGVGIVDPHPLEAQRHYFLTQVLGSNRVRLALCDGQLVGFIAASAVSVTQLHVRIGHQRQGVGTALLTEAKANSHGSLWLYTFARNRIARAFYERNGFVDVAHGYEADWQLEDVRFEWTGAAK